MTGNCEHIPTIYGEDWGMVYCYTPINHGCFRTQKELDQDLVGRHIAGSDLPLLRHSNRQGRLRGGWDTCEGFRVSPTDCHEEKNMWLLIHFLQSQRKYKSNLKSII